ncbi:MAG: mechanosensitive ion channel family protein [Candidatus Diapherotrites archaeon]
MVLKEGMHSLPHVFYSSLTGFLTIEVAGNYIADYIWVVAVFLITILIAKIFKYLIKNKIKKIVEKTGNDVAKLIVEVIEHIGVLFYVILALYISLRFVDLQEEIRRYLDYLLMITIVFYSVKAIQTITIFMLRKGIFKSAGKGVTTLFENIIKIFLWTFALLLILQNLGYKIDTLITGLGIAGIAVAFAMQKVLEDIFSALSIYFDKPFSVGDFVVVGQDMGTVKDIGLRSTRIQSLQGPEIVIPNREMTSTRVTNYKKMERRRVEFSFTVTYETPIEKLEKIPKIIAEIIRKAELADLERVHLKRLGEYGIIFEVVYYMKTPDYFKYMDTQQEINYALIKELRKEGVKFAYPTQTVYLNNVS